MEEQLTSSLFRFITLRAPETADDSNAQISAFVTHPDITQSKLYHNMAGAPSLHEAVQDFSDQSWQSASALKKSNPPMYEFAGWLSRNQDIVTNIMTQQNRQVAMPLGQEELLQLWDNFFYQAGTQADPYLRDMIVKMLVADNLLRIWLPRPDATTPAQLQSLAKARILVPKEILGTNGHYLDHVTDSSLSDAPFTGSKTHTQALEALVAKESADRHENAMKELATIQAAYEKVQNKALIAAQRQLDEALVNSTDQSAPDLLFTAAPEMDRATLQQKLSPESFYTVDKLGLIDTAGFDEASQVLAGKVKDATGSVFEKIISGTQVVVAGGTGMEVKSAGAVPFGFTAKAIPVAADTYKIALVVNTDDKAPAVVSAQYSSGAKSATEVADHVVGDHLGIIFFPEGIAVPAGTQSLNVQGQLRLASGITATFNVDLPVSANTGINGKLIPIEDTSGSNNAGGPVSAAHGIRRLGIADYRRVEQTVCCYVAGEVSHIENIMAREYKERSTRRLRRSEDTTTAEQQTEREHLTDSTSTDRHEMQQETAQALAESTALSLGASANVSYRNDHYSAGINLSANYASNMSKQQSDRQAVNFAREVTERASDKLMQKVSEQRVSKIIEEYEEQDKHGFDNRGDNAVNLSGVYRWVDKVYKNQVVNYGTRLMYEFMIPEPAVFHKEALAAIPAEAVLVTKPVDPRTGGGLQQVKTAQDLSRTNYAYWAAMYNVAVEVPPAEISYLSKSFSYSGWAGDTNKGNELYDAKENLRLPEGYVATGAKIFISAINDGDPGQKHGVSVSVGNLVFADNGTYLTAGSRTWTSPNILSNPGYYMPMNVFETEVAVSVYAMNYNTFNANISVKLQLGSAAFEKWQATTFNAVIKAYEAKLEEYNKALAEAQAKTNAAKETNPMYYRVIEQTVLKKNCVTYLVGQNYMGQDHVSNAGSVGYVMPKLTVQMGNYAAVVQFMEQAFEWEIISYSFFPFYWAKRDKWTAMYNYNNDDPIFRAFMQAGMARVVVPVRPGFEEAVMYYMSTGQVWNGGDAPVVDDLLYRKLMDALHAAPGAVEDTWETKVPTTLTVIQKSSVGLDATGLPCDESCGDAQYFFSSDAKLERLKDEGQ